MNYADKLERYVTSYNSILVIEGVDRKGNPKTANKNTTWGRIEYKPDSEDFWYWLNNYDPMEDGLVFVEHSKVAHPGYAIWKFDRWKYEYGYKESYYFMYRDWTGHFMPIGVLNEDHLQMAATINKKVRERFQQMGTMKKWTTEDTLNQYKLWQLKQIK